MIDLMLYSAIEEEVMISAVVAVAADDDDDAQAVADANYISQQSWYISALFASLSETNDKADVERLCR